MVFPSPTTEVQIATAGEALIDLIQAPDGRLRPCEGGAVYNLTRALGLHGVTTLYLNPLSQDRFGRGLAKAIAQAGVRLAQPEPAHQPTSLAVVSVDDAGKASYSFYREGVADRQVDAESLTAACTTQAALRMVVTGCLALVPEDAHKYQPWLQAQRVAGRLVVVDANLRPAIVADMPSYRASVLAALQQADLIKVSDEDLALLGFAQTDPLAAWRALLDHTQARWIAVTLGPQGAALLARNGQTWRVAESQAVAVVDTVGAGDCFLAGLLVALLERPAMQGISRAEQLRLDGDDIEAMLAHATASASLCVARTGCQPPTRQEVLDRLKVGRPTVA